MRLDDHGKLAPLLVRLHNVPIRIYSPHCALAAVLTLVLPQPPSTVSNIDYTSCVVALLGRWAKHISPGLFPDVVSVVYTPDGLIVLPDASPTPEAQIEPSVTTVVSAPEVQTILPDVAAVAPMPEAQIALPNAIHTPEAQVMLPDASQLLFVCGTTKVGRTTKVGEATLKEVWGKERTADLDSIVGRHPLNASTASKIPSSITSLERLGTMLVSLFGADSDEGKILGRYRDLLEELISTGVLPAWNKRGRRHQGTQSLGDCAETWGLTVMGSILPKGSIIISLSMHQGEIHKITEITEKYTILPSIELKPACYNCLYLFTVLEIKCEITVTDAAWDQRKTAQDPKGQNAQTGSEVASMERP